MSESNLNRYSAHSTPGEARDKMCVLRRQARLFADMLEQLVPEGQMRVYALHYLELAMMCGNKGISRQFPIETDRSDHG